ncbi:MAG: hypothetical protein Q4C98_03515 [Capnocytophaga sp.]|nr:hypothetical protein [Capnocytophaga sp.]
MEYSVDELKTIFKNKKEEIEKEILVFKEKENIVQINLGLNINQVIFEGKEQKECILFLRFLRYFLDYHILTLLFTLYMLFY